MKSDKEYLNEIYEKYEQEKDKSTIFYNQSFKKRNSILKNVAATFLVLVFATTGVFGGVKMYERIFMMPSFTQSVEDNNANQIWCGTFSLVWNDLMNELVGGPVEFEDYESDLANELNKQSFTADMLDEDSYYKVWGKRNLELKNTIEKNISEKFKEKSNVLTDVQWESSTEGYVLYAMLKKNFNFLEPFNVLDKGSFGQCDEAVKYFGIDKDSKSDLYKNVEVLYYNSIDDFGVKLKTKENEDVILYRTNENTSFDKKYAELLEKSSGYPVERKQFIMGDTLKVPYIDVKNKISYDELCNHIIKGTDLRIVQALQTIDIKIDNKGGKLLSEALLEVEKSANTVLNNDRILEKRHFNFDNNFIIFLKESDKEKPYFAMFVTDTQVLVK